MSNNNWYNRHKDDKNIFIVYVTLRFNKNDKKQNNLPPKTVY